MKLTNANRLPRKAVHLDYCPCAILSPTRYINGASSTHHLLMNTVKSIVLAEEVNNAHSNSNSTEAVVVVRGGRWCTDKASGPNTTHISTIPSRMDK